MPLPEYAIALGDVYAEMGETKKAEEQYELVGSMDRLLRANGLDTDLEIALFYADHDIDLQTSLELFERFSFEARVPRLLAVVSASIITLAGAGIALGALGQTGIV